LGTKGKVKPKLSPLPPRAQVKESCPNNFPTSVSINFWHLT
jgi:hypothetical protein